MGVSGRRRPLLHRPLSSDRARSDVRHFQLAALANVRSDDSDAVWLRVVSDMQEGSEKIGSSLRDEVGNRYAQALQDEQKTTLNVALAESLEAAGRPQDALAAWNMVAAELKS